MMLGRSVIERLIAARCRRLLDLGLLQGQHVLVVDNDPAVRLLCEVALTACSATVTTAESACFARALVDIAMPDSVVSNVSRPGGDAYDLVDDLRRRPRPVPVLAMAEDANEILTGELVAAGFAGLLLKPFDPVELCTAVAVLSGGQ